MSRIPPLVAAFLVAILAGCDLYECTTEARFVRLETALAPADTGQGPTGSATVSVDQFRGSAEQQLFSWFIQAELPRDSVEALLLRAGSPADPGEVLFEFPVNGDVADVLSVNREDRYDGQIPYETFFEILRDENTFIEVRRLGATGPALTGELTTDASRDWHDSCT